MSSAMKTCFPASFISCCLLRTSSNCSIVILPARIKYSPVRYLPAINPAIALTNFGTAVEKNPDVLQKVYDIGRDYAMKKSDEIKEFIA
jgi:hypothetical protein